MSFDIDAEVAAIAQPTKGGVVVDMMGIEARLRSAFQRALASRDREIERLRLFAGTNGAQCALQAYVDACKAIVSELGKVAFPEPAGQEALMIHRWHEWAVSCLRGELWTAPPIVLGPASEEP